MAEAKPLPPLPHSFLGQVLHPQGSAEAVGDKSQEGSAAEIISHLTTAVLTCATSGTPGERCLFYPSVFPKLPKTFHTSPYLSAPLRVSRLREAFLTESVQLRAGTRGN